MCEEEIREDRFMIIKVKLRLWAINDCSLHMSDIIIKENSSKKIRLFTMT